MNFSFIRNKSLSFLSLVLILTTMFLSSCEQTNYDPIMTVAPGGGTVSTYKAYTLASADSKNIYGRVVFYKYSTAVTLVQIGLYNTAGSATYTSSIFQGALAGSSATVLKPLDTVSGATGAFASNKVLHHQRVRFLRQTDYLQCQCESAVRDLGCCRW